MSFFSSLGASFLDMITPGVFTDLCQEPCVLFSSINSTHKPQKWQFFFTVPGQLAHHSPQETTIPETDGGFFSALLLSCCLCAAPAATLCWGDQRYHLSHQPQWGLRRNSVHFPFRSAKTAAFCQMNRSSVTSVNLSQAALVPKKAKYQEHFGRVMSTRFSLKEHLSGYKVWDIKQNCGKWGCLRERWIYRALYAGPE